MNPLRRSHRERFVQSLEEQLSMYQIENDLEQMKISITHYYMEKIDKLLMRIFNVALRKVEGIKRNVPYSSEKEKRRANVLYQKI